MPRDYVVDGWGVIEFMGHVRLAGRVSVVMAAGVEAYLVEVPAGPWGPAFESLHGRESLFRFRPTTEEVAMAALAEEYPEPLLYRPYTRQIGPANDDDERYEVSTIEDDDDPPF